MELNNLIQKARLMPCLLLYYIILTMPYKTNYKAVLSFMGPYDTILKEPSS